MFIDDYVRSKIAEFAWQAAHHVSIPAMLSVMFVVKTRVGETQEWQRVLKELEVAVIDREDPNIRDPSFREILRLVDGILPGDTGEPPRKDIFTSGALYWWDGNYQWFDFEGKERVSQVGTMTFWK